MTRSAKESCMSTVHRAMAVASLALLQACAPSAQAPAAAEAAAPMDHPEAPQAPASASIQAPGDPRQACNLLTAAELSSIFATPMVATPHEGDGVSNCNYTPASGSGKSLDFTVMRDEGEATLRMDRGMKGHDATADARFAGIGDDAVAVPPAVQVRVGRDLLVFTLFGVDDEPGVLRRIVAVVQPRL
jgi:hypothetical protein